MFHGTKGQLFTQAPYSDHPFNDLIIQASQELSKEFPFDRDWNDGSTVGIGRDISITFRAFWQRFSPTGWTQCTIDSNSERSSGVTAFLSHTGENVHILLNTQVTRVMPVRPNTNEFRVVEVGSDAEGQRKKIIAEKEVIVSGGVIGTPHILLHSGIGDKEELEAVGVKTLINNPSVGKNLSDHVSVATLFSTSMPKTRCDVLSRLTVHVA